MIIEFRRASTDDIDGICLLMSTVAALSNDSALYVADDAHFVVRHILDEGFTIVAFVDNLLAGFCLLRLPGTQDDNLGRDLGLPFIDLSTIAHIESVAVYPEYRGMGLQTALVTECERAVNRSTVRVMMCTVSPDNLHSLKNFERLGYRIAKTTRKYGGLERPRQGTRSYSS